MPKKTKTKTESEPKKETKPSEVYQAVGRRKESTARVKLFVSKKGPITLKDKTLSKGEILVNFRPVESYFPGKVFKSLYLKPFVITETLGRFTVSAIIEGGGARGQLDAFVHGVSRALEKVDKEKYRPILKKQGFITRDSRVKERRKAGFAQKARARKQSPKR